jgi:hypothetical protein
MSATFTPDAPTFRALVADVAARAKALLPASINGRLEGAVRLVLAHDVTRLDDGTIEVGSSTDPLKTYHLVGTTCQCRDFVDGKAPEGWCRHRIAAGIDKRVREVLAAEVPRNTETPLESLGIPRDPLPEAPASINLRAMIGGFETQITLRDTDESRLLARLEALLKDQRIRPVPRPAPRQGQWQGRKRQYQGA